MDNIIVLNIEQIPPCGGEGSFPPSPIHSGRTSHSESSVGTFIPKYKCKRNVCEGGIAPTFCNNNLL